MKTGEDVRCKTGMPLLSTGLDDAVRICSQTEAGYS